MIPFRDGDLQAIMRNMIQKTMSEISELDNQYVLKVSKTEFEDYYINKVLIEPLILYIDKKYIKDQRISKLNSKGYGYDHNYAYNNSNSQIQVNVITLAIPFEGDKELWKVRPSSFIISGYPDIEVSNNEISFSIQFRDNSNEQNRLQDMIENNISTLKTMVNNIEIDVRQHNKTAPDLIRREINNKITNAKATTGIIESLGIPIKKADESPFYAIPTHRKPKPISMPKVQTEKYEPEPILEEKEYQYILEILRSMSLVIERNPKSFSLLDEESIRDHFLLQLNGHYVGGATGETFNASGKTDILIREKDKNVFIAECKFWHGPKLFSEAIDQLLSYLTWRDSKTALMIFNKNQNSGSVLEKMNETMENHPEHKKTEYFNNKNGYSRYIFVKDSEPGKEVIITTQLYDIPK